MQLTAGSELHAEVPRHVRVPTAARITGLTIRQLYERIDRGELSAAKDDEGMVVVPTNELDSLDA